MSDPSWAAPSAGQAGPNVFLSRADYEQILAYYDAELAARDQRIAELTAALAEAQQWEPVPQEEPFNSQGDYVMGTGQGLAIWLQCSVASAVWHGVPLGENIRLMRRVAGAQEEPR